jgi:hypothetical protein
MVAAAHEARRLTRTERSFSFVLAGLMLLQPLLGLLVSSAYRDVPWIKAAWFGNDLVTLLVVVPMLLTATTFASAGSRRARLVWLGALAYGVYNYVYYLLGAALNVFFALYVITFVLAIATLIIGLVGTDVRGMAEGFRTRTPVRSIGGFFVFVAAGLSAVWFGTWAAYVFAGRPTPVATEAFKLVAALDTTIIVPALAVAGVLLWRRNPWGYVLSAAAGIQATLYLLVLTVNSAVSISRGLVAAPGELPIWGTLLVLTFTATAWLVRACDAPDKGLGQNANS